MSNDDLFNELEEAEAKTKKRGKKEFPDALPDTTPEKTAKAAGRTTYKGSYWARTLRLPPAYREVVLAIYQKEPRVKSIADLERWLFAKGIEAYMKGERPEYAETIERAIELPEFGGK